jgi:hypothetical protein
MTARDRVLLTIIVPALLAAGLWFAVVAPKRAETAKLDGRIAAAQTRLAAAQGEIARSEQARGALNANLVALAQAGRAVPAQTAMEPLLRHLQDTARHAGVRLVSVDSAPTDASAPAANAAAAAGDEAAGQPTTAQTTSIDLTMSVESRFPALRRFLAALQAAVRVHGADVTATGRLLSIRSITATSEDGALKADIEASAFVLDGVREQLAHLPQRVAAAEATR